MAAHGQLWSALTLRRQHAIDACSPYLETLGDLRGSQALGLERGNFGGVDRRWTALVDAAVCANSGCPSLKCAPASACRPRSSAWELVRERRRTRAGRRNWTYPEYRRIMSICADYLVELRGFEPLTSAVQRYIPAPARSARQLQSEGRAIRKGDRNVTIATSDHAAAATPRRNGGSFVTAERTVSGRGTTVHQADHTRYPSAIERC